MQIKLHVRSVPERLELNVRYYNKSTSFSLPLILTYDKCSSTLTHCALHMGIDAHT